MGQALFLSEDGRAGATLGYYAGEVITGDEAQARRLASKEGGDHNLYLADLRQAGLHVDARYHGNNTRFIAHLCEPNVHAATVTLAGGLHAIRFTLISDSKQGTLLGFDYGWTVTKEDPTPCQCGGAKCRGTIEKLPVLTPRQLLQASGPALRWLL
jgi:SET domain-containing protein